MGRTGGEKKLKPTGPDLCATLRRLTRLVKEKLSQQSNNPQHLLLRRARQLGHSSINITVDIYGHFSDNGAKEAMETLGRLLND